jgi:hypothetical protein
VFCVFPAGKVVAFVGEQLLALFIELSLVLLLNQLLVADFEGLYGRLVNALPHVFLPYILHRNGRTYFFIGGWLNRLVFPNDLFFG